MGKYLNKFKEGLKTVDNKLMQIDKQNDDNLDFENLDNDDFNLDKDWRMGSFDDAMLQIPQKPESFHHFILENEYHGLERSIRGFKDIFDKEKNQWVTKRKAVHCFTDEEAENIVRMAQGHLAKDIKLANMSLEAFGKMMDLLWEQLESYFYRIAEYRYGRYGKDNYDLQGQMKDENKKILIELYNNIWANYSRSIGGRENRATHESVKGQESLQSTEKDIITKRRAY